MKGKINFNRVEEKQIKVLVEQLRRVSRDEQKKIRYKLRNKYQFFISDFTKPIKGFKLSDFENLKNRSIISIS